MYERGRTLFDHHQVACTVLGFQWMSEHQRRSLVRELRDEVARCADRDQLLVRARQWLYKNKLVIVHERAIRTLIAAALAQLEVETRSEEHTSELQSLMSISYAVFCLKKKKTKKQKTHKNERGQYTNNI